MSKGSIASSKTNRACHGAIEQCAQAAKEVMRVKTVSGIIDVQWSSKVKTTAMEGLYLFFELLKTSSLLG